MLRRTLIPTDWIARKKIVDEKESAEIEANLTTLSKGPVEDVKKYIDEVKARTQQAMNVRLIAAVHPPCVFQANAGSPPSICAY